MKQLIIIFFSLLLAPGVFEAYGQNRTNTTEEQEKKLQFKKTIAEAQKALDKEPARGDLMVLIANNFAWQQQTDSALVYIRKAQGVNYYNDELFDAWLNILLWGHRYDDLLQGCNIAAQHNYQNRENLLKKRLQAYTGLKKFDEGIDLAKAPENRELLKLEDIKNLYGDLLMVRNTNVVSAFYSVDCFDSNAPQHLANLGYSFRTGKHTLALRGNYANRFGQDDLLLEGDFYLQMKNRHYMYFNYGYAFNASLFPRHRVGYEYYMPLKGKMEASLGMRYMKYAASEVLITTGHLEKYMGSHWVAFRPFYVFQENGQSLTLLGNYRLYGKNPLNYWGVELSFGNSPDDSRAMLENAAYNDLQAYKIKLERNVMLNRVSDIRIGIGYSREEQVAGKFRNRYLMEVGYRVRLK